MQTQTDPIASVPFKASRRCVAMIPPMSIDLTETSDVMAAHARIPDRRRFEHGARSPPR
jgi:hypothetical protein